MVRFSQCQHPSPPCRKPTWFGPYASFECPLRSGSSCGLIDLMVYLLVPAYMKLLPRGGFGVHEPKHPAPRF